ncbi:hypothetical protein N0V87_004650 [Didymella glomerata]|uniref:Uncharacterized protein n=1 Tax=Didymella glomerata TaxID=749621 RepID=A0A9W9C0J5_9PLEO|nr:hypothetical protein N0V87_004650 [Didymella glomerata]
MSMTFVSLLFPTQHSSETVNIATFTKYQHQHQHTPNMKCSTIIFVLPLLIVHAACEGMQEELAFADRGNAIAPDEFLEEVNNDSNDNLRDLICFGPRIGSDGLEILQELLSCPGSEPPFSNES